MLLRVNIPTFERPDQMQGLLLAIDAQAWPELEVAVYDDGSKANYSAVQAICEARKWIYKRFPANHGKAGHYRLVNRIWRDVRKSTADMVIQLADDFAICQFFFVRALLAWASICDSQKICLNLFRDNRDEQWGMGPVRDFGQVRRTDWFDGAYLAHRSMFQQLRWKVPNIPIEERQSPHRGTGVYRAASHALVSSGYSIYQVRRSLCQHQGHKSVMHPHLRAATPLTATHYIDE